MNSAPNPPGRNAARPPRGGGGGRRPPRGRGGRRPPHPPRHHRQDLLIGMGRLILTTMPEVVATEWGEDRAEETRIEEVVVEVTGLLLLVYLAESEGQRESSQPYFHWQRGGRGQGIK